MTESPNTPLTPVTDEAPSGLDDLLASVRSEEAEIPKKRRRKKREEPEADKKASLWATANKLRNQMDPGEYKHLVLGLIFLKYISDTFVEHQQKVLVTVSNPDPTTSYRRRPAA